MAIFYLLFWNAERKTERALHPQAPSPKCPQQLVPGQSRKSVTQTGSSTCVAGIQPLEPSTAVLQSQEASWDPNLGSLTWDVDVPSGSSITVSIVHPEVPFGVCASACSGNTSKQPSKPMSSQTLLLSIVTVLYIESPKHNHLKITHYYTWPTSPQLPTSVPTAPDHTSVSSTFS